MWLYDSSVGKKVVMSISGIALILFLTFHRRYEHCGSLFWRSLQQRV